MVKSEVKTNLTYTLQFIQTRIVDFSKKWVSVSVCSEARWRSSQRLALNELRDILFFRFFSWPLDFASSKQFSFSSLFWICYFWSLDGSKYCCFLWIIFYCSLLNRFSQNILEHRNTGKKCIRARVYWNCFWTLLWNPHFEFVLNTKKFQFKR